MKYRQQFITIFPFILLSLAGCSAVGILTGTVTEKVTEKVTGTDAGTPTTAQETIAPVTVEAAFFEPALPTATDNEPGEVTAKPADLWQRIRDGFALAHHLNESRVRSEFNWYASHPAYLDRVALRAERHLFHIVEEVEKRDLPMELALLPIVESAFDPFAYSHGRAAGLWQFIPATGRRYGLTIDYWYDGRRDVPAATTAALDYLEALYKSFDQDWMLALAAYNSGEGNVRYSIRKNQRAGKATDFFSLGLLRETRAYVPRLLAISALIEDPGAHAITLKSIPDEPYWASVDIGSQLDLARAAELAGISTEELYLLNPAFNKWSTHPDGPHHLLLPVDKAEDFTRAIAALPNQARLRWIQHPVESGENLGLIAQQYNTTVDTIRTANNIRGNLIRTGEHLMIPVAAHDSSAYEMSDEERLKDTRAHVAARTGKEPQRYTVQSGDSLWELSRRWGVGMRELAKWNGMATTDLLMPGTELAIFTEQPLQLAIAQPANNEVIRKVNYRVRNGESLSHIADKFNLPLSSIKKWNQEVTKGKYIQPGDRLTLFVDVTAQN